VPSLGDHVISPGLAARRTTGTEVWPSESR
jgi:hypothetical protein